MPPSYASASFQTAESGSVHLFRVVGGDDQRLAAIPRCRPASAARGAGEPMRWLIRPGGRSLDLTALVGLNGRRAICRACDIRALAAAAVDARAFAP